MIETVQAYCTIQGDWRQAMEADANGLVSGHAYTITKVMRVSAATEPVTPFLYFVSFCRPLLLLEYSLLMLAFKAAEPTDC